MNQEQEDKTVMCVGAPMPPDILETIKGIKRAQVGDLRWNDPRNWFINFQTFYRSRPNLDIRALKDNIKANILFPYFPLLLQPRDIELAPTASKPRSLEFKYDIIKMKDAREDIVTQREEFTKTMQACLQETCYTKQTIECDPSLIWARIPQEMHKNSAEMEALKELRVSEYERKQFYIEKLYIVMVTRDEFGLQYDYTIVEE
ncbi:MAG: hypothetical protein OXU45_03810 [Candidatus Melainabacteria bacterium]|nr:hypothetical protein [Candidatus Melainabacteria bacterium]